ncbi:hypothetical protein L1049_010385 [Liquidambar formosana]|uniref:Ethylene-responsive nuclear protein n=1 Tax=Liquidambar formosana TaxID=63359 RepID=A0AAP0N7G7_LIQFO
MPLPWKKARVTRISRLVADLHSPKHGGSLVVETGFPTSLIDLFVKNRDRLKKPSSKKKRRLEISDPVTLSAPPLDLRLNSSAASDGFWGSAVSRIETHGCRNREEEARDFGAAGGVLVVDDRQLVVVGEGGYGGVEGPKASGVFWAILKVFIVVVLALGTKKLAVGITMSAFVLLFLEYAGKHVVCLLKPCSHMQTTLKSFIQRVFRCVFREQGVMVVEDKTASKALIPQVVIVGLEPKSNDPIEEIEIIEPNLDLVAPMEEIQTLRPDFEMLNRDKRWGYEEIDTTKRFVEKEDDNNGGEVVERKNRCVTSAKLKSHILKKFVPKKFRTKKKGKRSKEEKELESHNEVSGGVGEDKVGRCEEQQEGENGVGQGEDEEVDESEQERSEEGEEIDVGISSSGELSEVVIETAIKTKGNSGYLFLVLIVLAGLVGGRVVALLLTIGLCSVFKSVGILRRFTNVSMIRSPV